MCVQPFLQETLEKHQECLKKQREAVKYRQKKLSARQSEVKVSCVQARQCLHRTFYLYCDNKLEVFISYGATSDAVIRLINAYAGFRKNPL